MLIQQYKCKSNQVLQVRVCGTSSRHPNCTSGLYRNIGAVKESGSEFHNMASNTGISAHWIVHIISKVYA
jgi:hypothetical protein